MTRLRKNQRRILEMVEQACLPARLCALDDPDGPPRVIPLYIEHLPDLWIYERERQVFIENLAARGLIRIEKRNFLYITDAGREAVCGDQKGTV